VTRDPAEREQLQAIGEAAEALWDAARRFQDLLDELESERLERWAAYTAFREIGSVFRFALERLGMEEAIPELKEIIEVYRSGARAGFGAAADLAGAVKDGGADQVETGVERLTLASQQFVRGRYLLEQYLEISGASGSDHSTDERQR
jgi:hypothetical protein